MKGLKHVKNDKKGEMHTLMHSKKPSRDHRRRKKPASSHAYSHLSQNGFIVFTKGTSFEKPWAGYDGANEAASLFDFKPSVLS